MRAEVVSVVRELAREKRPRFRASFIAERAGVTLDEARRDLVKLAKVGDLIIHFELICPFDDASIATFDAREQIPTVFASDECGDGEEFDVTPELIWVTFSPTDELIADAERENERPRREASDEGSDPPSNPPGPSRWRPGRASTSSRPTSAVLPALPCPSPTLINGSTSRST